VIGLAALSILQVAATTAASDQSFRMALTSCERPSFTEGVSLRTQQIEVEQAAILRDLQTIVDERAALQSRRDRRRRNGPFAGIFSSDTNEVAISNTDTDLRDRQALLSDRQTLLNLRVDLLRSQVETFRLRCLETTNAPHQ
jgi:hypothetical protein